MEQRQTSTKKNIKESITILLNEIDFEAITVTMICKRAGINRGTFYLHYLDKYDMINQLKEETLGYLSNIITKKTDALQKETILESLNYIYQEFTFISSISKSTYINYRQTIYDFVEAILDTVPDIEEFLKKRYAIPLSYAKTVHISIIQSLIVRWIETGGKESPEVMADIIFSVCC